MIKDIVVNLSVGAKANWASDYAISVAAALDAHLTGIVYGPVVPVSRAGYVPPELEVIERHNQAAVEAARESFTTAAARAGVNVEPLTLSASLVSAGDSSVRSRGASTSPLSGSRSREPTRSKRTLSKPRCSIPVNRSSSFLISRKRRSSWTTSWFAGTVAGQRRGRSAMPCRFCDGPDASRPSSSATSQANKIKSNAPI